MVWEAGQPPQIVCPYKLLPVCVQACWTPSERGFSCAGHAISQEVYLAREGKYGHFSAKEQLKFEAGLVSIPTQHLFCCYLLIV